MAEENEKRARVALWGIMFGFFQGGEGGGRRQSRTKPIVCTLFEDITLQNYFEPHRNLH